MLVLRFFFLIQVKRLNNEEHRHKVVEHKTDLLAKLSRQENTDRSRFNAMKSLRVRKDLTYKRGDPCTERIYLWKHRVSRICIIVSFQCFVI